MLDKVIRSVVRSTVMYTNTQIQNTKQEVAQAIVANNQDLIQNQAVNKIIHVLDSYNLIQNSAALAEINRYMSMTEEQIQAEVNGIMEQVAIGPQPLPPGSESGLIGTNGLIGENGLIGTNGLIGENGLIGTNGLIGENGIVDGAYTK
jgi:UDP-3-O-[3-hydroxymyristoyl] glucosamine N-acyltransferase